MAESMGVRIFTADIIYHLFDQFTAYLKTVRLLCPAGLLKISENAPTPSPAAAAACGHVHARRGGAIHCGLGLIPQLPVVSGTDLGGI